jgi:hypothetical protein
MGQNNPKNKTNDTLLQEMEDEFFGNVTLYYNDQNPYTLKCTKTYTNSANMYNSEDENINKLNCSMSQNAIKFLE